MSGHPTIGQASGDKMIKWLRDSGMSVNESKTEICLFYKNNVNAVDVSINNVIIRSKPSINILGVQFDSKLTWDQHISNTISRAKRTLHGIRLIKRYFNKTELKQLLTSNFYSVLYYNAEIWLIPSLHANLKKHLLSCSAQALKLLGNQDGLRISFETLHRINDRATPMQMLKYKHSLLLFKLYNSTVRNEDWIDLNFNQSFNSRSNKCRIFDESNVRVGKNILTNRLTVINNQIEYDLLNKSLVSYKIACKRLFLK